MASLLCNIRDPWMLQGEENLASAPHGAQLMFEYFGSFKNALLSTYLVTFEFSDARDGLGTLWPTLYVILMCLYNFIILVIMLNMLISLMADLFNIIKIKQKV